MGGTTPGATTAGPPAALTVAGSLWSVPSEEQAAAVTAAVRSGLSAMHWDHSDGDFAAAGGFPAAAAADLAGLAELRHEAHLMFTDPVSQVDAWSEVCERIVVHVESEGWQRAVDRVARRGREPAVALSPHTPSSAAPDELAVLCMSVVPGRAGSRFDRAALRKVTELAERNPDRAIGLDGGVTRAVVADARAAGATWLVVGNDLFGPGGLERWTDVLGGR